MSHIAIMVWFNTGSALFLVSLHKPEFDVLEQRTHVE